MIGQNVSDTQCGMRLIHKDVFENLDIKSNRFEFETEMLIKAGRANMKIKSVPIKCIYNDNQSKIQPFKDTIRWIKMLRRLLND